MPPDILLKENVKQETVLIPVTKESKKALLPF